MTSFDPTSALHKEYEPASVQAMDAETYRTEQKHGLTLREMIVQAEEIKDARKTTLLITQDWELINYHEYREQTIIGRIEIGIYPDPKDHKIEDLRIHRLEIDFTGYDPNFGGGIESYFLDYLGHWLKVYKHPTLFKYDVKRIKNIPLEGFPEAQVELRYTE